MVRKKIIWDEEAKASFKNAYQYIRQDSLLQAERIKSEIITATKRLVEYPEIYPPDKFRRDKDQRFRAFEMLSFRISYFLDKDAIRILRFRHVKQEPKEY
jgi:plasmid stabilization system protein ParE